MENIYKELDLGHKIVKFRKWKVKDRKALRQVVQENPNDIIKVMVLDCLEDSSVALSPDELQYIFIKIREESISDNFNFSFNCGCGNKNKENIKISDVTNFTFSPFKEISIKDLKVNFCTVKNAKFYNDKILDKSNAENIDIVDLILHIDSINDNIDKTFDEMMDFFMELDSDVFDELMQEYNKMNFKIDNSKKLSCKQCQKEYTFIFDEIPDFFPKDWITR